MVLRLQQVEGEYRVVLSAEAVAELGLRDGAAVEVRPVEKETVEVQYATVEETMKAFYDTEPDHRETYRELAK